MQVKYFSLDKKGETIRNVSGWWNPDATTIEKWFIANYSMKRDGVFLKPTSDYIGRDILEPYIKNYLSTWKIDLIIYFPISFLPHECQIYFFDFEGQCSSVTTVLMLSADERLRQLGRQLKEICEGLE